MSQVFYKGDCLVWMKKIPTNSIDFLYVNPPFATTKNVWDEPIPWKEWFEEAFRVLKPTGMLAMHCSIPFNYTLIREAPRPPLYSWYWKKEAPTMFLSSNFQPMRDVEEILVWKKQKTTYYRQQIGDEEHEVSYANNNSYFGPVSKKGKYILKGKTRTHFLDMKRNIQGFSTRPDEMVELMLKSYTKEGDTVLDTFCYKGLTGKICKKLNRRCISIDKNFIPDWMIQGE